MRTLAATLTRNALWGGGARLVTLAVGLFITPYLLTRLGVDRFGIWALVTVVTGTVGLFDFSFKSSFIKHLAEAIAKKDDSGVQDILSTGFFVYLVFSIGVALAFVLDGSLLLTLLKIPPRLADEALSVFLIGVAGYLLSGVLSVFPALCDAHQRMDLTNGLGVAALLIGALLTVIAVESGFGLQGVAYAQLAGIAAFYVSSIFAAKGLAGSIRISPMRISTRWLKKMFPFGLKLHISSACGIVNRQLDKFLLTRWAGLGFVSSYEIALRMAGNAGTFQPYLAAALLPASSQLEAAGEGERLVAMYRKASKYLFLVGIPPFVYLAAYREPVMTAWLGHTEPTAALVLLILAAGYMVNSLSNAMAFTCQGIGRPGIQTEQSALQLAANVVLSLVLFLMIGPLGAPLGTSLALLAGAAYFAWRFHRHLGITTVSLLRQTALAPLLASVFGALAAWLLTSGMAQGSRIEALLKVGASAFAFGLVYGIVCFLFRFIGRSDLRYIRSAFQSQQERLRR